MASYRRKKTKTLRSRRRFLLSASLLLGSLAFFMLVFFSSFVFIAKATYKLPDLKKGKKLFTRAQTTKIFDTDGNLITNLYVEQNRVVVPLDKISPNLRKAVVAIEDKRFFEHEGVDLKAIARAFLADMKRGRIVEGGSTLTQQFVKNTLITPEQTFDRKIREATLALQVESKFSKKEILEGYLNTIYFGQSAYGAETAAQTFFDKSSLDLSVAEAALMAGVIRSPNTYSPYINIDTAKRRRDLVINAMRKEKMISPEEAQAAIDSPIAVQPLKEASYPFPYFVEYVKQTVLEDSKFGTTVSDRANALLKGGLRIYTTIDPKMQQIADDSVWSTLDRPEDPAGSLVAIEPKTGYIRAMVGGKDWKTQKLNLASQGFRQPGSAFKPFVLATALSDGMGISKTYQSNPTVIKLPHKNWVVNNAGGGAGRGMMTLHDATVFSVNAVFARLIMDVGPNKVAELSKKMGIVSPVESLPAIALGGLGHGVSTLDMSSAYATFANSGQRTKPIAITKITDADGNIIKENNVSTHDALDPVVAYLVTDTLQDVIRYGTGRRANIGRPAAGKTGTAEHYGDAWFVGFTPDLSTAVWVGYRDSNRWMTNVHGITVQGGTFPAEIWRKFMSRALSGKPASSFERPAKGIARLRICDVSGYLANQFCPEETTRWATFASNKSPRRSCDRHTEPPTVAVPNVIGTWEGEARAILEEAGFSVVADQIDRVGIPEGQVLSQSPSEGDEAPKGSSVTIEVSSGRRPKSRVPGVIGQPAQRAQAVLRDAGFSVETEYVNVGESSRIGKVISQTPSPGKTVELGVIVEIRVGK